MKEEITPVKPLERIALLDILRGLAIFGILMVNMQMFYQPATSVIAGYAGSETIADKISTVLIKFLFEGKFYILFSLLFGYGFWMFINKKTDDGSSILPVFRRRVAILLMFGILHVVFLWAGDILVWYAVFGFVLILFRKKSDRSLIKWAFWLAIVPVVMTALSVLMVRLGMSDPQAAAGIEASMQEREAWMAEFLARASAVYSEGTFGEIIRIRLQEYMNLLPGVLFFYPVVLGVFLVGVWAARSGIIRDPAGHVQLFRRILWWGLITGVVFSALYTWSFFNTGAMTVPDIWMLVLTTSHIIAGFSLSVAYVSGIVLLYINGRFGLPARLLAPVGRMALTNYLLQSIICTTLFFSYGFGLFGKISVFQGVLLTLVIFGLQIPFSLLWLKHFYFGPFEWLWRSLTYMKLQPFIRK